MSMQEGRLVHTSSNNGLALSPCDFGHDGINRWWACPPVGDAVILEPSTILHNSDNTISIEPFSVPGYSRSWRIDHNIWLVA